MATALSRNNRLLIILFSGASICFLLPFLNDNADPSESGFEIAERFLASVFSGSENNSSAGWMVLVAGCFGLAGCILNLFTARPAEMINVLIAGIAYLNLFSFRTERLNGYSLDAGSNGQHFEAGYWIVLILFLVVVIQQLYRFLRWQNSGKLTVGNGFPSGW